MKHYHLNGQALLALFLMAALVFTGCKKNDDPIPPPTPSLAQLYAQAVQDAMVADSSEITDQLWPITPTNPDLQWKTINGQAYVLMGTFMRYPSSYPAGDSITTVWGDAWLFIPKQMKNKIGPSFTASSDTIQRICQLLGLPPVNAKTNTHISTMWVKADRLYRPAGNPAIDTKTTGPVLVSGVSADYTTWFNNYIIFAYYHPLTSATDYHYPWTRMGYTYDWAPGAKHVGLSEYVMQPNSGAWVEQTTRAQDFFKN
ncbi:hypothetical protein FHW36_10626 [Chitinophaga polysaccharea]|uniref:Lipoprotein n=1 Tax=Chitinophaga polysaccharea TaxID=1293035 RepID=A0A561PL17_9BACT|nr:hypothetical protein [Chitinophaga polysaccharea]TWF38805.1 hypothetical protein FHW36_10626 [Chitinophaga polysaccharea]